MSDGDQSESDYWIIDPETLIMEVKSRPLLYARDMKEYSNKSLKKTAWEEVSKTISDDWDEIAKAEQYERCRYVQSKWKHIYDYFRRELQAQNDSSEQGKKTKKKKRYKYYEKLLFLIPHLEGTTSDENQARITEPSNQKPKTLPSPLQDSLRDFMDGSPATTYSATAVQNLRNQASEYEDEGLKTIRAIENMTPDEDVTFCLSLVQSLKKMDDATKLTTKIEILNAIRKTSYPPCLTASTNSNKRFRAD